MKAYLPIIAAFIVGVGVGAVSMRAATAGDRFDVRHARGFEYVRFDRQTGKTWLLEAGGHDAGWVAVPDPR